MTTKFYDINALATSYTFLDHWTYSGTSSDFVIALEDGETPVGDKFFRVSSGGGSIGGTMWWDARPTAVYPLEQLLLFRPLTATPTRFGLVSTAPDRNTWGGLYLRDVADPNGELAFRSIITNSTDILQQEDHSLGATQNVWLYMRLRVTASGDNRQWQGRVWKHGETEPSTWPIDRNSDNIAYHADLYGWGGIFNEDQMDIAFYSVGTDGDSAPFYELVNTGITITGIKEPNEANTEVTGVSTARVKVWHGTDDTGAEDEIYDSRSIENGALEVNFVPEDGFSPNDTVTVEAMWTVGTERKLFITETNVVEIGSGS